MLAYSSTVLALMKSECLAAEPLAYIRKHHCGVKKLRILFRSGRCAYVKSAPKCIISTQKNQNIFWGGEQPQTQTLPPSALWRLESAPVARPWRLRRLDPIPPLLRNHTSAPGFRHLIVWQAESESSIVGWMCVANRRHLATWRRTTLRRRRVDWCDVAPCVGIDGSVDRSLVADDRIVR